MKKLRNNFGVEKSQTEALIMKERGVRYLSDAVLTKVVRREAAKPDGLSDIGRAAFDEQFFRETLILRDKKNGTNGSKSC